MPSDDLARGDDLAGVALGVLGRMKEQTQHIAGELCATNRPYVEKVCFGYLCQAAQRILYGDID